MVVEVRGSRRQKSEASVLRLGMNSCLAIWLANMICAWSPRTVPKDGLSGFKDGLSGLKDGLSGFKDGLSGSKDGLSGSKDGLSGSKDGLSGSKATAGEKIAI